MLTLLSECHFWTTQSEIRIKETDFGAFKYSTKRELDKKCTLSQAKRDYAERRDTKTVLGNEKPTRLRDNIKRLEELLATYGICHCEWRDGSTVQLLLAHGLIVHILLSTYTGDIIKLAFDKYFIGKSATDTITDAVFTRQNILLAYNTNQITVVYLQKPNMRRTGPEKISNMDPKIFHVIIPGPSDRKLSRQLAVNSSFDLVTVWTKSSQNEIYPWRPTIRDQDRANIHVYKIRATKLDSMAYCWTENDPICVEFLKAGDGHVLTVEQKISRKGEITAEICSYEIGHMKMQRVSVTSISMGTQICCYSFSPDQEKIILGTIDRYVCIHNVANKTTKFAPQIDIIPTQCAWHPDSSIIIIANERSQFQFFDMALSSVANQPVSEDVTPSNLHDLSHYFAIQPTLLDISFGCKPDLNNFVGSHAQTDCFLLLMFENGPIGCLRFFAGTGMTRDVHNSGLTPDVLVSKYLAINQFEKAVNILLALNWETYGAMCLIALHKITNYVFTRHDVKRSRNDLLIKALKSFSDKLSEETENEFGDQVIDMKRRFFVFLLRHKLYIEAFEIAKNIEDYDLFMDLYNVTKLDTKLADLSHESFYQAELILNRADSTNCESFAGDTNSLSSCSHLSCTECLPHLSSKIEEKNITEGMSKDRARIANTANVSHVVQLRRNQRHPNFKTESTFANYVPPLPSFKSPILSAENIKINIPKPELRTSSESSTHSLRVLKHQRNQTPLVSNYAQHHRIGTIEHPVPTGSPAYSTSGNPNSNNFPSNYSNQHVSHAPYQTHPSLSDLNLPRSHVLEVLPSLQPQNYTPPSKELAIWSAKCPDQTIGIPLTNTKASPPLLSTTTLPPRAPVLSINYPSNRHFPLDAFANNNLTKSESLFNLPIFYQHPLVSGTIPSTLADDFLPRYKKSSTSILTNSSSILSSGIAPASSTNVIGVPSVATTTTSSTATIKRETGERNKVKFSDTVQVAVVPEIPRKEKQPPIKRNGFHRMLTDPKKELADSLPLCHPNDDYLKDFNPVTDMEASQLEDASRTMEANQSKSATNIKVVHFGVV